MHLRGRSCGQLPLSPAAAAGKPGVASRIHSSRAARVAVHAKLRISQNHGGTKSKGSKLEVDLLRAYTDGTYVPDSQFAASVTLQTVPGKGRGLYAVGRSVVPSDLLLVAEPAGRVVCGPEGTDLRPEQLLPHLQAEGALSDADKARLALLYDGSPASLKRPIALSDFHAHRAATGASSSSSSSSSRGQGPSKGFGAPAKPAAPPPPPALSAEDVAGEQLEDIVRYNSWGIEHADTAAAPMRGQQSRSYIGVWPEFSLVNHSCVPNTVSVLVGDRMLLRAAAEIPESGELTTTYLGPLTGAPVSQRRSLLKRAYGFTCGCPRCKTESSAPEAVGRALDRMWAWMEEQNAAKLVSSLLTTAPTDQTVPKLQELLQVLEAQTGELEGLMEQHALDSRVRMWLRTSAFGSFELLAVLRDETDTVLPPGRDGVPTSTQIPPPKQEHPESLLPLISIMAPASDTHLYLAFEVLDRCGKRNGAGSDKTIAASRACLAAHLLRYGQVPQEVLAKILATRAEADFHMGRINLPTPWASTAPAAAPGDLPAPSAA